MTAALPRVPDPSPPAGLYDGVEIPVPHKRFTPDGVAWFRTLRIPLHKEDAVFASWKKDKRSWLVRGFSMARVDGVWSINQNLAGAPGAYTLTNAGADTLRAHDAANVPKQVEIPLAPAELVYPELPDGMEAKLMPHQVQAARQLLRALQQGKSEWGYSGALDMSDMGTGKTYQDLAAALATGLSVGVITPPAGRKGWMEAFRHFGAEPEFLETYEGIRGGWRPHIAARNADGVFRWKDPGNMILIMDEAQSCFPYATMIATDRGPIPIGQLVDEKLTLNVWTYDIITHTTTLRPVVNWFRNPPAGLVTVHHQYGSFTCTSGHHIFTRTRGWIQAGDLSPHDYLLVLSADVAQNQARHLLRQEMCDDTPVSNEDSRTSPRVCKEGGVALRLKENEESAPMRVLPAGFHPDWGTSKILLPALRDAGPVLQPSERDECGKRHASRPRHEGSRPHSSAEESYLRPHEGQQPNDKSSYRGESPSRQHRENFSVPWGQWSVNQTADGLGRRTESTHGARHHDGAGREGRIPQRPEPLQGGLGRPIGEIGYRSGWQHPHHEEVEILGPPENRDPQLSRVDRVEVLESGRGLGSYPRGGNDPLYDFEVEGTHCYFADGVLVHNCRHTETLTVECFSAAIRQSIPIICASATLALSPLEFRFAGRIVGLHDGGQDWDCFLLRHGCSRKTVGGKWKWNEDRTTLAKIHARLFPGRGCRVKMEDLGDDAPETEITVLPVHCPEADRIQELYLDGEAMAQRLQRQNAPAGKIMALRRNNRLRTWQASEKALVEPVGEMVRQSVRDGWSVALFMSFNDSRIAMGRMLNSPGGIYGGVSPKQRDYLMSEFQADRLHILVNNVKSGGVSLSLHDLNGDRPRKAFIFPCDELIKLKQSTGRVARAKAKTKSEQFIPCVRGSKGDSVMEKMVHRLREKMRNLNSLNNGTAGDDEF